MGSVWGDAEYEFEIAKQREEIAKLTEAMANLIAQNAKLVALAKRVTELEGGNEYAANLAAEARALVRLIGGVE
jgi:hypothetical protein